MTIRTQAAARLASVAAAALILGACSDDSGGSDDQPAEETTQTTDADSTDGAGAADTDEGDDASTQPDDDSPAADSARAAGIDPNNPPEPIASTTVAIQGSDKATVDLYGLARQGDLVVLTLGVTLDEGTVTTTGSESVPFFAWFGTTWSPTLVDSTTLNLHQVVESDDGPVMTATGSNTPRFGAGETYHLSATFAAPPEGVTTMTVNPMDGASSFLDVPIE